ncbi:MAG TPA: AAA family ATPase [Ktedonobacterales bacterium]
MTSIDSSHTFAELLRRHRHAAGLSQEALADRAGLSRRAISDLERGLKQTPRADTVDRLARALALDEANSATLAAAVRRRRLPLRSSAPPSTFPRKRGDSTPLVGRGPELARLEEHLRGDGPPLLLLTGEPGIGKSRLLAEVSAWGAAHGWYTLGSGCQRGSAQDSYAPILNALARHAEHSQPSKLRNELRGASWLVRMLPELAERKVLAPPAWALDPAQERRLMFTAVARLLENVAGPAGTLLWLDDLQWAGRDALELLGFLLRCESPRKLCIVGAYRETELHPQDPLANLIAEAAHEQRVTVCRLGPLGDADASHLLTTLLREAGQVGHQAHERIVRVTGGVPYFLVSYAREVVTQPDGAAAQHVPWTVAHSIRVRIAALPHQSRVLLAAAAVIERGVPLWLLAAISASQGAGYDEQVASALDATVGAGLLLEDEGAYHFTHDLIREVTLADVSFARAQAIHRRAAEALVRLPAGPRERHLREIAHHYIEAGEGVLAVPYLLRAGEHATRVFAYGEAEHHFRLAADLAASYRDSVHKAQESQALEQLGYVLRLLGRYDEALDILRTASDGYEALAEVEGIGRVTAQIAWVHLDRGSAEVGIRDLLPVVEHLLALGLSSATLGKVYLGLAQLYLQTGRFTQMRAAAEKAFALAQGTSDHATWQHAASLRDLAGGLEGRTAELITFINQMPPIDEFADPEAICRTLIIHAHVCDISGAPALAEQHIKRAMEFAERTGSQDLLAACLGQRGHHRLECGQWQEAMEDLERAEELESGASNAWWVPLIHVHYGYLLVVRGHFAAGVQRLRAAIALGERAGSFFAVNWARYRLAERYLVDGRYSDARVHLEATHDVGHNRPGMQMATYAWALLELGEILRAELLVSQSLAVLTGDLHSRTTAQRIQAMIYTRQERWDEAQASVESALGLARSLRYPYGEARTLYVAGLLRQAQGDPDGARAYLEEALSICESLGERLYRPQIYQALRALPELELSAEA